MDGFRVALAGLVVALVAPGVLAAQDRDWCRESRGWRDDRDRGWACEVREMTLPADREVVTVDGGLNGGVRVEAWDRNEILVRARVTARARDDDDAEAMLREIRIETGGTITSDGPHTGRRESWGVSFHVFVPRRSNLDVRTHNGGIGIEGVSGRMRFDALNGGVDLVDLSGDVQGQTTNGGLDIRLAGRRWEGEGMDVRTTNGGVEIHVPDAYSVRLETGTTNGGISVDFPVTVQGRLTRRLSIDLGDGGQLVRAVTVNGGVRLRRG